MNLKPKTKKSAKMRVDRLREIREMRQLTQQQLADTANMSLRQIARYESGESDPSSGAITDLAKALECSADYLLGLTDKINGYIAERDLTPMERRLLNAYRNSKDQSEKLRNLIRAIASDEDLMAEPEK